MKQKILIISMITMMIVLSLSVEVSAYKRMCLSDGQSVPSNSIRRFTCNSDLCIVCVNDNLYPTHPGYCNTMSGCNLVGGGNATIDQDGPNATVTSPIEGKVYNSRLVLFDIVANEQFTLYWKDNKATGNAWKRVMNGISSFKSGLSFKEGLNDITIKLMDRSGNNKEFPVKFYVDSQKPKIKSINPTKGFSNGVFNVKFTEQNPTGVELNYGNDLIGYRKNNVSLTSCTLNKGEYSCDASVDVLGYNGGIILFWFNVYDMGNNVIQSKKGILNVDATKPVINNPDSMINIVKTYAYFSLNITEQNFASASYKDLNDPRARSTTICTKLKNGKCEKKTSLKKGSYEFEITVLDSAGNKEVKQVSISVI